ncbi:MAG: carbohydrate-binding family 9-like protein [Myxococcota bacterium]
MLRRRLLLLGMLAACYSPFQSLVPSQVISQLQQHGRWLDAQLGGGAITYLGFENSPNVVEPGSSVEITHYWLANRRVDRDYRIFVHTLVQGARGWTPHGDHDPPQPTSQWSPGKVVADRHRLRLPKEVPGNAMALRVGLFDDAGRIPIDASIHDDGQGRLRAGDVPVSGKVIPLPEYRAVHMKQPPVVDGIIDETEWQGTAWIDGFTSSMGNAASSVRTRARLGWDAQYLYVAMIADDPDIIATLRGHDAPVYREEAVELFIDAAGTGDSYIELQVSPLGVRFDAAFHGGPRRNMQVAYNAQWRAAVAVDGTPQAGIGEAQDVDRRWSTEWAILLTSIPNALPLTPNRPWRINLLRIAKDRHAGALRQDESAWSPPLMGDFHNLERFGKLWFAEAAVGAETKREIR